MEIKVFKTYEISNELWDKIAEGFRESFDLNITSDHLKSAFCIHNRLGYGYHAVAITEEDDVAGYNVYTPTFYKNNLRIVVSGSTYVRPKYRKNNEFLYMDMVHALTNEVIKDGFDISVGVPNQNSKRFAIKILKAHYVGDLNYYIMPRKFSKCINKPYMSFMDPIMFFFLRAHLLLQSILTIMINCKERHVKYELLTGSDDLEARFKGPYKHIASNNKEAYYRLVDENGTKTAYLMDFREGGERTSRSLNFAVRSIIKNEKIDAVLFVGLLRLRQLSLFKVPRKLVPKPLPLTYNIINKEKKEFFADMDNIDNWNFSLMNFDVR